MSLKNILTRTNLTPAQVRAEHLGVKSNIVESKQMTFTPEQCQFIFDNLNPLNRVFSKYNGLFLSNQMTSGKWATNGESVGFDFNGEITEGQHRFWAGWNSGLGLTTFVVTGLDPSVRTTLGTGKKRNVGDALSYDKNIKDPHKIGAIANMCIRYENGTLAGKAQPADHDDVTLWVANNPLVHTYYEYVMGLNPPTNCGVTPTLLASFLIMAQKVNKLDIAKDFVYQYSTGVGIELNSGVYRFQQFVRNNNRTHGRPTNYIYLAALIRCFSDFKAGKIVKSSFSANDVINKLTRSGFPTV